MQITTLFITRYVDEYDTTLGWHETLFGRPFDSQPMPSCREWRIMPGVLFQLIIDPARSSEQVNFAFKVEDLDVESERLRSAGISVPSAVRVEGFDDLRYIELADPYGLPVGLLQGQ